MARKKEQNNTSQSFSGTDEPVESLAATPLAQPLSPAEQAFQLATFNKQEINQLREDINNPKWAQEIIEAQLSLQRVIKFTIWLFLIILILLIISFILFSVFEMNNLLNILELISTSKKLDINDELLGQYNDLFRHCKTITNFFASVLGSLGVIGFFTYVFVKVVENKPKN